MKYLEYINDEDEEVLKNSLKVVLVTDFEAICEKSIVLLL